MRLIIRRPHAYWFRQRFSKAPIPGFVFMSPEGKVVDTFPLQVSGQTLEKLRSVLKSHRTGTSTEPPKPTSAPKKQKKATFRVPGVMKTASGAT